MNILKTLDRALAASIAVTVGAPTFTCIGAIYGACDYVAEHEPEHRNEAKEVEVMVRAVAKLLVLSIASTVKYGYFASFTHPEARVAAAKQAAELIATMYGLPQTEAAEFVAHTTSIAENHVKDGHSPVEVLSENLQNILRNYGVPTKLETFFNGTMPQA
jgi:hypothetical protein